MTELVLQTVLPWATIALYCAVAGLLVWKLMRSHESAFAWLGVAVVVWPLISYFVNRATAAAYMNSSRHGSTSYFPYSLAAGGSMSWGLLDQIIVSSQQLIGGALLLLAVIYLCRMNIQHVTRQEA
jgi:hypothetical protein